MMKTTKSIDKRKPSKDEKPCPYDGIAYSKVPGYVSGYGCPVCKGIGPYHLPIPETQVTAVLQSNK
jgi:hypothetical protein